LLLLLCLYHRCERRSFVCFLIRLYFAHCLPRHAFLLNCNRQENPHNRSTLAIQAVVLVLMPTMLVLVLVLVQVQVPLLLLLLLLLLLVVVVVVLVLVLLLRTALASLPLPCLT
jgi:hypothetical protein